MGAWTSAEPGARVIFGSRSEAEYNNTITVTGLRSVCSTVDLFSLAVGKLCFRERFI